jgi:dTDP-4-dehydrorhamnose reductase
MKILIAGSKGMLAADLIKEFEGTCEIIGRDIHDFDICDKDLVIDEINKEKPDCVINCAAYTHVDNCETDKDLAFSVNGEGVKNLALGCKEAGSLLCHVSTDFVFDGKKGLPYVETDMVNPLSVYGMSKLEGEKNIQEILEDYLIVRTSWLFGRAGKNFVETISGLAKERDVLEVVNDQTGSPTFTVDLSRAIKALIDVSARGVYHVSNSGICTWFDFACKICELTGGTSKINPVSSDKYVRPAVRPVYSVMDCSKFKIKTGLIIQSWEDALMEYLDQ